MLSRKKRPDLTYPRIKNEIDAPEMSDPVLHQVIVSEIVLLSTIMVCTIMIWNNNLNVYGISYFGVRIPTLPVVAFGFVAGSIILIMASRKLPDFAPFGLVKLTLRVVSVGIVLLLLTPFTVDTFFNWTHMTLGAIIFAIEMYTGVVLCFKHLQDRVSKWALALQFFGGVLAMLSVPDNMLNFMIEGEVIFQLGFMILLNHLLRTEPEMVANSLPSDRMNLGPPSQTHVL